MTNYADAGVDIDAGNRAVKLMGDAVRSTNTLPCFPNSAPSAACSRRRASVMDPSRRLHRWCGTKVELAARHGGWNGRP